MKIVRMNKGSWGKINAFFDIETAEGFTIKGFKLVEGTNGMFVGFPSQKGSDDEYRDTVWAEKELRDEVKSLAKKEWENPDTPSFQLEQEAVQADQEVVQDDFPF